MPQWMNGNDEPPLKFANIFHYANTESNANMLVVKELTIHRATLCSIILSVCLLSVLKTGNKWYSLQK